MKARDIFSYSFSTMRLRKLRAGLTTLGVVIGIAAIVALLSITQGLQDAITGQLQTGFATNTLIISTRGGLGGFGLGAQDGAGVAGSGFKLLVSNAQAINNTLSPDIEASTAIIQRVGYLKSGGAVRVITIVGVDFASYANIYSNTFTAESGSVPLNPTDEAVVAGKRVSDPWKNGTLFCDVDDSVEIIWTNATRLPPKNETYGGHVAAVLEEIGGFGGGGPSDSGIYVPISRAESFFGTDEADMIVVKLKSDDKSTMDSVSKTIVDYFSDQVSVTSATAVLNILSSVFSTIELFLAGIAAISLLVAGIGIMNIMIVSLMERTREIGVLKALGMKSRTVLFVFLCESVIVGLIGAAIGIVSGWILANVVAIVFGGGGGGIRTVNQARAFDGITITPVLTPTVTVLALVFGVGVSAIFALYPAWRASKLKPVEALRYE